MFTRDDLIRLLTATPFVPFRLHLSSGGHVEVRHKEWSVVAGRRYAAIGIPDADAPDGAPDRHVFVFYMHVTDYELLLPGQPPPSDGSPPAGPQAPVGTPA